MALISRWIKIKQTSNLPIVPLSRNNFINRCKHLEAFMTCRKNPKLQHVQKVFPLGGTTSYPITKCSASKGKCVGTGCNFGFSFLLRRCPGQSFIVEGLNFGKKVGSDRLICIWDYEF